MGCLLKDKATNCIPHALQREMLELILPSLMLKVQNTDRDAEQLIIFFDELHPEISRVAKIREAHLEQVSPAIWLINSGRAWMEDAF